MVGFADAAPTKVTFPGPLGTKRRRMRSGGNVSTLTNNGSYGNGVGGDGASNGGLPTSIVTTSTVPEQEENISEEKTTQTSKCKGATTIPIFLKKTYKMVDTCDPNIASWTEDGEMFVVKDPDIFATHVIPQYFDHNKFSSFARQLNFYGFRKMQSKPIRNSDFDAETAKHVTFFNENFKRGRCDLLKKIQRSTRGGGPTNPQDQTRELQLLRDQISNLEMKMVEMEAAAEERIRRVEIDMLARMEQMMLAVRQQQQAQLQLEKAASVGTNTSNNSVASMNQVLGTANVTNPTTSPVLLSEQQMQQQQQIQPQQNVNLSHQSSIGSVSAILGGTGNNWGDFSNYNFSRNVSSISNNNPNGPFQFQQPQPLQPTQMQLLQQAQQQQQQQQNAVQSQSFLNSMKQTSTSTNGSGPTLPPHPKQKMIPGGIMPGMMAPPIDRINSLRGISTFSRGISGLSRGASIESAVLDENMFNLLMMEINDGGVATKDGTNASDPTNFSPTPIADQLSHAMLRNASQPKPQLLADGISNTNGGNTNNPSRRSSNTKADIMIDREDLSDVSGEM